MDASQSFYRRRWAAGPLLVILVGGCSHKTPSEAARSGEGGGSAAGAAVPVEVVHPVTGGIERTVSQPATAERFEGADLYSKVSGFLDRQSEIGTPVKKGQVLAHVSVPELDRQVEQDAAKVNNARAKVEQARARVSVAEADARAAQKMIGYARSEVQSRTAYRTFREKQSKRIQELNAQQAVDARVADEKEDQFEAAQGAEIAAKERVGAVEAQAEGAAAKILQARADLSEAVSEVAVAQAELDKAKVMQGYTTLTAPCDGVITNRTFEPGALIRASDGGPNGQPVLSVERTDLLRVVIPVPDQDAPYVKVGAPAVLVFPTITGPRTYHATVSRTANALDPATRTMRVEVDLPNADGAVVRGAYTTQATLIVRSGAKDALRIPSAAVVGRKADGSARVRVVRDGKVRLVGVHVGLDNGIEVEVTGELSPADQVVSRVQGEVAEGTEVKATPATADPPKSGGH